MMQKCSTKMDIGSLTLRGNFTAKTNKIEYSGDFVPLPYRIQVQLRHNIGEATEKNAAKKNLQVAIEGERARRRSTSRTRKTSERSVSPAKR